MLVERDVRALADDRFCPTFLRNATAFGASPRIRFDIVLNNLAGLAWTTGRIAMTSDGMPWRPLVHVQDICQAVIAARCRLRARRWRRGLQRRRQRATTIASARSPRRSAEAFPNCAHRVRQQRRRQPQLPCLLRQDPRRSCRASAAEWDADRKGAGRCASLFAHIAWSAREFNAPPFTRLRELQQLLETRQIDQDFYWRPHDLS